MTKKSKEVAVKQSTEVSHELAGAFDSSLGLGAGENIDNEDILVPKIHLAQALTPEVSDKESDIEAGVYMNSIEKSFIADKLDLVIIGSVKLSQWYAEVKVKGKVSKEYLGTTDYKEAFRKDGLVDPTILERAEASDIKAESIIMPDTVLRFTALIVDEIKDGMAFPYFVDFKRTSLTAGRQLQTNFAKLRMAKLPSYAKVFELSSKFVSAEHDYYIKAVSTGRNITKEELETIESWAAEMSTNKAKYQADESDVAEDTKPKDVEVEATVVDNNSNHQF